MQDDNIFEELRRRIDYVALARHLDLAVRGDYISCPAGAANHKKRPMETRCITRGERWHCHGCKTSGDAVDMISLVRGVSKADAIEEAKGFAGIVDGRPLPPPPPPRPRPRLVIIEPADLDERIRALTIAEDHYCRIRREGSDYLDTLSPMYCGDAYEETIKNLDEARAYLQGRGFAPLQEMRVKVGLVPSRRTGLEERLISEDMALVDAAIRVGLLREYRGELIDTFAGRVFLPWHDADGRVINGKGRGIPKIAKACGQRIDPETGALSHRMHFLRTSNRNPDRPPHTIKADRPFGWCAALEMLASQRVPDKPALVVEGELDAMAAMRAGYPAVATGGVSAIKPEILRAIIEDPERWCLCFDGDEAGLKAAPQIAGDAGLRWTNTTAGDINDILVAHGAGGLGAQLHTMILRAQGGAEPEPPPAYEGPAQPEDPDAAMLRGMPKGWVMRGSMLCRLVGGGDGEDPTPEPTGSRDPPAIAWRGRDIQDGTLVVSLAGTIVGSNDTAQIAVDRGAIKESRKIVGVLADHGFDVDSTTASTLVRFLSDYEHAFGPAIPFKLGARQMGWHGGSFLYGRDCYGDKALSYIGEEVRILDDLGCAGTMDAWREGVLRPLERYPAAIFGLYAAMAAPVMYHQPDLTGFALEYSGESSAGKTTVLAAIASAFGWTTEKGGLLRPFLDTAASTEIYAALMNNLPIFIEDVHLIGETQARDMVMAWANGQGKGRAKAGGTARQEPKRWSTVALMTGEASITNSTTYAGVGARVLSFPPPLPERGEGDGDPQVVADIATMDAARVENYGHAGRMWVQHLVGGGITKVRENYARWLPVIQSVATSAGPQQRWAKYLALTTAVAEECSKVIGGAPIAQKFLEISVAFLRDTEAPDQAEKAMDLVLAWVASENRQGIAEDEDEDTRSEPMRVWYRIISDGTVCVSTTEVAKRLREEGIMLQQVRRVWMRRGYLRYMGAAKSAVTVRLAKGTTSCIPIHQDRAERVIEDCDNLDRLRSALGQPTIH